MAKKPARTMATTNNVEDIAAEAIASAKTPVKVEGGLIVEVDAEEVDAEEAKPVRNEAAEEFYRRGAP